MSQHSLLDEAYAARHAGNLDDALRTGIALLEADAGQLGAAMLVTKCLVDRDRGFLAGEIALKLVDAYIRRGDLSMAVVAASVAETAGEEGKAQLKTIAQAFGKGSKRLGEGSPTPPPLPTDIEIKADLKKQKGQALLDRGERALQSVLEWKDPIDAESETPRLPLFSRLEPAALEQLLAAFEIRSVAADETVVGEGEEGSEAFVLARGMLEVVRGEGESLKTLAGLGPGALFGEMALVSDAPRAAAVISREPATLLVISRDALEKAASKSKVIGEQLSAFCRSRMLGNLMRHSPILGAVAPTERQALLERFSSQHYDEDDILVAEGDEAQGLFLIASGTVEVLGVDSDGDQIRIAELGPGDVVGEISLVLRRPANATVRVVHPTVAMQLTRDEFQAAIKEHPTILSELYEMATKREEETRTVVAQEALDVEDIVLL